MGFWDWLTGEDAAKASNAAAADTYAKQQAAANTYRATGQDYAANYGALSGRYDPYVKAGGSALQQLLGGLGLGGNGGEAFTNAYRSLPGYQSGLETGTNAALRGANASGMSNSGRALKALQRFGSDYEDQRAGSYLDRLMGLSQTGLGATGAQVGTIGQGLEGQRAINAGAFGADYGSAGTIGEGLVAGEQAKQNALKNLLGAGSYLTGSFLGGRK